MVGGAAVGRRHGHVVADVEVEGGLRHRLLLGVGVHDVEVHGMAAAGRRGQKRGGRHVAEQAGSGDVGVVGDPADAGGHDHEHELVAPQAEPRRPAAGGEREGPTVAAAEPVDAHRTAAGEAEVADDLAGGPTGPLPLRAVGVEVPAGDGGRDERRRHEEDPAAVGEIAAGLPLELPHRGHAHRHLVVERDRPRLDAGVVGELPGHRRAEPVVAEFPGGLVDGDGGDAERGGIHGRLPRRWQTGRTPVFEGGDSGERASQEPVRNHRKIPVVRQLRGGHSAAPGNATFDSGRVRNRRISRTKPGVFPEMPMPACSRRRWLAAAAALSRGRLRLDDPQAAEARRLQARRGDRRRQRGGGHGWARQVGIAHALAAADDSVTIRRRVV